MQGGPKQQRKMKQFKEMVNNRIACVSLQMVGISIGMGCKLYYSERVHQSAATSLSKHRPQAAV